MMNFHNLLTLDNKLLQTDVSNSRTLLVKYLNSVKQKPNSSLRGKKLPQSSEENIESAVAS